MMSTSTNKKRKKKTGSTSSARKKAVRTKKDYELVQDIKIIAAVCVAVFLFVCNFGVVGKVGDSLSNFFFGLFGVLNYIAALFFAFIFIIYEINAGDRSIVRKSVFSIILFLLVDMIADLISGAAKSIEKYSFKELYLYSSVNKRGGGLIAGSINYGLLSLIDMVGTIIFIIALILVCVIFLTEKSFVKGVRNTTELIKQRTDEDRRFKEEIFEDRKVELARRRLEKKQRETEEKLERERELKEKRQAEKQAKEDALILNKNKKVVGVTKNTLLVNPEENSSDNALEKSGDIHEINLDGFDPATLNYTQKQTSNHLNINESIINSTLENDDFAEDDYIPGTFDSKSIERVSPQIIKPVAKPEEANDGFDRNGNVIINENIVHSDYRLPPISLLGKGIKKAGDSAASLRQTAQKLQDTLAIFGVEATVTDISQGPTVTRFELQPKLGVKVSRIKNLSDDIKLNLAASEIRIEAPIPGKAAIGIEVPNKEAQPVYLRELLESSEFNSLDSNLAFAVGKDITGKTIVYGINNFPHLLIAGATGAGKSVCINTMIMSILYKANPDDVKIIMIDPKVVELSVYNGIPHLMLPVVTDIKKAAATLNFAVNEMHERYNKFAEYGVRDIEGYTRAITQSGELEEKKMPHLVIIVDEVADLMLSERKNVEDAIQSLTQLARAAGIHLIIATQRPSVDVITGVIKANMPSRIAFAVSSNVDSRTILDMGGAEELLGKGDMLFFPKGLKKPVRLQGGFVSDNEVNAVVEFVKKQGTPSYDSMIEEKIKSYEKKSDTNSSSGNFDENGDGNDSFFADAGFYIIDNNKASIGMLQRKFKMGFNRAARIMDQLSDAGVVGPDEGTKPRQILMSHEQFENYLEQNGG